MSEEKQEKIFVDGIKFETIPDEFKEKIPWIKGRISIKAPALINFLEKHQNNAGWVNINLCKSQKGNYYFELNQFKPKKPANEENEPIIDMDGRDITPNADNPF